MSPVIKSTDLRSRRSLYFAVCMLVVLSQITILRAAQVSAAPVSRGIITNTPYYIPGGVDGEDCTPESVGETSEVSGSTTICCPTDSGDAESVIISETSAGSTAEKLFIFLIQKGLTAKQAAGIIGNVMQESGGGTFKLNPAALNPKSGAYGIAQWYAGRKTALIAYADSQGKPHDDMDMQMDYLWKELSTSYRASVLTPIQASTDYTGSNGSLRIWLEHFEIPCSPPGSACDAEYAIRKPFADKAYAAFKDLGPTDLGSPDCSGGTVTVDANGYAFPIVLPKDNVSNGYGWPCKTTPGYCHHDNTPAFDLAKKALDDSTTGTEVVAIYNGEISNINKNYEGTGCQSIQYKALDGYYYWYGHIRTDSKTPAVGAQVKAGQHLAKVGESLCTGNGSYPHLHIDRGFPKGRTAGEDCCRDPAFIPLINQMYEKLP